MNGLNIIMEYDNGLDFIDEWAEIIDEEKGYEYEEC